MSTGGELAEQTVKRTEQAVNAQGDRAGYVLLRNEYEETLKSLSEKRDAKALEGVNLSNYAKKMDDKVAQDEKFLVFGSIWATENADKVEKAAQQKGVGAADGKLTQEELQVAYNDESMSKFDRLMIRQLRDNFGDFSKKGDKNKDDISKEDSASYVQENEKKADGKVFKTEDNTLNLYKVSDGTFLYKSAVTNSWKHIEANGIEKKTDKPIKDVKDNEDGSLVITFNDDSTRTLGADGKFVEAQKEKPKEDVPSTTSENTQQQQEQQKKQQEELDRQKQSTQNRDNSSKEAVVSAKEGYYQSAERILKKVYGLENVKPKDVLDLARYMRDLNGGNVHLKKGQQLITENTWQKLEEKIGDIKETYEPPQQISERRTAIPQ